MSFITSYFWSKSAAAQTQVAVPSAPVQTIVQSSTRSAPDVRTVLSSMDMRDRELSAKLALQEKELTQLKKTEETQSSYMPLVALGVGLLAFAGGLISGVRHRNNEIDKIMNQKGSDRAQAEQEFMDRAAMNKMYEAEATVWGD